MQTSDIPKAIRILKQEYGRFKTPYVTEVAARGKDPFKVLISCILSLRTKDDVTRGLPRGCSVSPIPLRGYRASPQKR